MLENPERVLSFSSFYFSCMLLISGEFVFLLRPFGAIFIGASRYLKVGIHFLRVGRNW